MSYELRPGGRLVGCDLLDTAPSRLIHRLDRSPHRVFSHTQLAAVLQARFDETVTLLAIRGLVCRFTATVRA